MADDPLAPPPRPATPPTPPVPTGRAAIPPAPGPLPRRTRTLGPGEPSADRAAADRAAGGLGPSEQPERSGRDRRNIIVAAVAVFLLLSGIGLAAGTYYVDSVPTPNELALPESTTVFFADGSTPMAKLGTENRTLLGSGDMNDAVKQASSRPRTRRSGPTRASTSAACCGRPGTTSPAATRRVPRRSPSSTPGWPPSSRASPTPASCARRSSPGSSPTSIDKSEILEFYLNTVPFGRGAYGIEAAAQAYLGKTANSNAPAEQQLTTAEAMVLVAMIKQPEAEPGRSRGPARVRPDPRPEGEAELASTGGTTSATPWWTMGKP